MKAMEKFKKGIQELRALAINDKGFNDGVVKIGNIQAANIGRMQRFLGTVRLEEITGIGEGRGFGGI